MSQRFIRVVLAILSLCICFFLVRAAGKSGLSRLYSRSAINGEMVPGTSPDDLLAFAEEASQLAPADPDAYRARGIAQLSGEKPAVAAIEFLRAVALRPRHYLLWMDLGRARDQADNIEGSVQAFREAVRLAPFFAQPRWQLANVLFRAERYVEAYPELRRAVAGDPTLLPLSMELVWASTRGDADKLEQIIDPSSPSARLIVGRFLAKHGKAREAVEMFRAAGGISESDQQALVKELIATKQFTAAYEVWASRRTGLDLSNYGRAAITDGGFENKITRDDPGFGWQVNEEVATVRIAIETSLASEGTRSLRLEWNGNSNPLSQLVTQIVLVEPKTGYRLSFNAMAKGIVSGGMPVVAISDASSAGYQTLGESAPLTEGELDWNNYNVDFKSGEKTEAVLISLQRKPCPASPCPIFGRVWLDSFSLKKS